MMLKKLVNICSRPNNIVGNSMINKIRFECHDGFKFILFKTNDMVKTFIEQSKRKIFMCYRGGQLYYIVVRLNF